MVRARWAWPMLWLGAAATLFLFFSYLAFRREPWPGAYGVPLSARWWSTLLPRLPTNLPTYNVAFTAVTALQDTDTFVAVGSGGGVARSLDGGKTWEFPIWTGRSTDGLVDVSFADDKVGWAVGGQGVILRSPDGGATWNRMTGPKGFDRDLLCVKAISPTRVVAAGDYGAILVTDDGGRTWSQPASSTDKALNSVDFATPQQGLMVGEDGAILRTSDGGSTWNKIDTDFKMALSCVRFRDPQTAWAAGANGTVLESKDSGITWSRIETPTKEWFARLAPLGPDGAIVVGDDILTTNDGRRWLLAANPLSSSLTSVASSRSEMRVAVGYAGSILTSERGGSWKPKTMGAVGMLLDVHASADGIWIGGNDGQLVASDPRGRSFRAQIFRQGTRWWRIIFSPDGRHGLVMGHNGELLMSNNGGGSWRELNGLHDPDASLPRRSTARSFMDRNAWLVGSGLWRTTDGGNTWRKLESAPGRLGAVAFADSEHGVVAWYPGKFSFTVDGGDNWYSAQIQPAEVVADFTAN